MKANDIFDFKRFGKYFVSDLGSCAANYGLSLLTLAILTPVALYMITSAFSFILGNGWDGPDMGSRATIFGIGMFCLAVTMPVKCYGKITEKQYGTFWLTLPASRLEKVISMIVMTCIITPLLGIGLYLGTDALICGLDSSCGDSIAYGLAELVRGIGDLDGALADVKINLLNNGITIDESTEKVFQQLTSPWLYIDEGFCITLPFLLGAICFRKGKTVKTFLAIAVISTAISIISTPIMMGYVDGFLSESMTDIENANALLNSGLIKNLAAIDMISDTILNLALVAGIWFRVKTLKH
jgi:hypothetical protein